MIDIWPELPHQEIMSITELRGMTKNHRWCWAVVMAVVMTVTVAVAVEWQWSGSGVSIQTDGFG